MDEAQPRRRPLIGAGDPHGGWPVLLPPLLLPLCCSAPLSVCCSAACCSAPFLLWLCGCSAPRQRPPIRVQGPMHELIHSRAVQSLCWEGVEVVRLMSVPSVNLSVLASISAPADVAAVMMRPRPGPCKIPNNRHQPPMDRPKLHRACYRRFNQSTKQPWRAVYSLQAWQSIIGSDPKQIVWQSIG